MKEHPKVGHQRYDLRLVCLLRPRSFTQMSTACLVQNIGGAVSVVPRTTGTMIAQQ
jgi:hypothetical protein